MLISIKTREEDGSRYMMWEQPEEDEPYDYVPQI